ncbi:MAG TPA: helix-turn-helix transcriptional regulator [Bryobacteraceae bacterium]|jgi:DNA-binding PadR family transcriptional regulator|nr:helix-turn-helix transcriptional regulator [Bryobacteraceae bacterium]
MEKAGPLPPATLLVLLALSGGDRHGYGIRQDARQLDPTFELGPATLYTTIQRLLEGGWIKEVAGPETGGRPRRYYRMTKDGNAALDAELQRMESVLHKSKTLRLRPAKAQS